MYKIITVLKIVRNYDEVDGSIQAVSSRIREDLN